MKPVTFASCFADYFDGDSAKRQRVSLRIDKAEQGEVIVIDPPDAAHLILWPVELVRSLPDQAGSDAMVVGLATGGSERLILEDQAAVRLVADHCPLVHKPIPMRPIWRLAITVSAVSMVMIATIVFLLLPGLASFLAPRLEPETEEQLGASVFESIGTYPICNAPQGTIAFDRLAKRVTQGVDLPFSLKIYVFDDRENPAPNAFALPGGYVVFFKSLIDIAETPEEIAAVFAHELAHVVYKDSVRGVLMSSSASLLVGLLSGDVITGGGLAGRYVTSSYSREAETQADTFARAQLQAVNLPPRALGSLFARMQENSADADALLAHFMSHPQMAARIEAAKSEPERPFRPVLSKAEWTALRNICSSHAPEVERPNALDRLFHRFD